MDNVEQIYRKGKLLARAMDWPQLQKNGTELEYNCTTWANKLFYWPDSYSEPVTEKIDNLVSKSLK